MVQASDQKINFSGEHLQHDDDQLSEGRRAERDAVVGHLLHLLRLRGPLRVRHHLAPGKLVRQPGGLSQGAD